ncbi:thiamine biosynthesis protein ThiI [Aerococcus urinaehominis]|uniref:Probable tRNA sulfurtransferase n=1 Tax=Aerococcus urinaehominis TaxID=128944 RepID=A0A109RHD2_9LACT|nr:tRNA uracil 4-sulfurtransferase ThiI [Aerococcus urinaehominis]AMB99681.1 thiamine biosynthesis protein ThiI [Aerococcus urinaehominis]SDL90176.1 thiamine biosynthesis protein ThiI [Aerococcus urinaehominis]
MEPMIMIRYGEISIKGRNKKKFTKRLQENIKELFTDMPNMEVSRSHDYMFIAPNGEPIDEIADRLKKVAGIQSFSYAYVCPRDFEQLEILSREVLKQELARREIKTFKVMTSRSDRSYEMDTPQINRELGASILDAFPQLQVDVNEPDLIVRVKVRTDDFFLSTNWIDGLGGLPVGSSANGLLMLSGGIDSPVAGFLAMKRGIRITAVHFASPPYTSPQALQKAKDLTEKLTQYAGWINFVEVPFTEVQEAIKAQVPDAYLMTITRRFMMRISDRLRDQFNAYAIINGESIGQVASQTLESMYAINAVTTTPVLRPLVTMDKIDIIDIAQKIDTYELSIQPFEDCCTVFAPPSPKTTPHLDKVEKFEARMDVEGLVNRAVAGIKFERIQPNSQVNSSQDFSDLL